MRIFFAAPPDCAGFRIIPDVCTMNLKFKSLVKRHICIETHPRFAEVKARYIVNKKIFSDMVYEDKRSSKVGSSMSPWLLDYWMHYSAYMIRNPVIKVSDLNHLEIFLENFDEGSAYNVFKYIYFLITHSEVVFPYISGS